MNLYCCTFKQFSQNKDYCVHVYVFAISYHDAIDGAIRKMDEEHKSLGWTFSNDDIYSIALICTEDHLAVSKELFKFFEYYKDYYNIKEE